MRRAGLYGVYLDIDFQGEGDLKQNLPPDAAAGMDLLDEFGARPTMIVFSGHGVQACGCSTSPGSSTQMTSAPPLRPSAATG
jgi:hypothetical protein